MRVTTTTVSNNYLKHIGRTADNFHKSREKAATLRSYLSVEEAPDKYVQEARIARDYKKNEDYQNTASQAMGFLQNQDKVMQSVIDMSRNISKKYSIEALNDTNAAQRKIYAAQLDSLQEAMVRTLNANDSGEFVFAGADGGKPPFELENGRLYYRGLDVQTGRKKDGTYPDSTPIASGGKGEKTLDVLNDEKLYYDLGYGLDTRPDTGVMPTGTGSGYYEVKDSSAFNAATSGLKAIGWADKYDNVNLVDSVNGDTYAVPVDKGENLVTLAGKLSKMLKEYDRAHASYSEFATEESGVLLFKDGDGRSPLTDRATGNLVYEKNTAVDSDGYLINKFTGNRIVKDTTGPKFWMAADVATNSSNWNNEFSKVLKKFDAAYNRALETETSIGVKMNFVEVTQDRLNTSEEILTNRFEEIAKITPEEAFTDYSFAQCCYNTALRLGSSIVPKTLAEMMPW